MLFYILFAIGVIGFIALFSGQPGDSFLFTMMVGTVSGLAWLSFSLFVKKDWRGFRGKNGMPIRISLGILGTLALIMTHFFWVDFPRFVTQDYRTLKGIPSEVEYHSGSGETDESFFVTLEGIRLPLLPVPDISEEKAEKRYFEIKYFPYSKWIVDYEIGSDRE
ncbi:hypothetical protein [Halobacillus trueperi]|uniref:hypothetical protein n=1 Tax=Halobacillus trueperi TaxID=156205 RepID=UPI0037368A7D